jgi:hypothetical protein
MLPNPHDAPTGPAQRASYQTVSRLVGRQLLLPEWPVSLRRVGVFGTAVPKAAVHENGDSVAGKSEIGFSKVDWAYLDTTTKAEKPSNATDRETSPARSTFDTKTALNLSGFSISIGAVARHDRSRSVAVSRSAQVNLIPPPSGDAMQPKYFDQGEFRIFVSSPANPRHHVGALRLGVHSKWRIDEDGTAGPLIF